MSNHIDRELMERLTEIDKSLIRMVTILNNELAFDKISTWNAIANSNKLYFVMNQSKIEVDFSVIGIHQWLAGNAEIKVRT